MAKLLSIVGPTATGKTAFALEVAKLFGDSFSGVDIISSDSRQIYEGLEIGTGVDVPMTFQKKKNAAFEYPYFEAEHIRFHGLSIIEPDQDWSVAEFQAFFQKVVQTSIRQNYLPILVGGTGFYRQQIVNSDPELSIPANSVVREKATQMTVLELQEWLSSLDAKKLASLNNSDRLNPRRLIRAIEVALDKPNTFAEKAALPVNLHNLDQLALGLMDSIDHIKLKIAQRVEARLDQGFLNEVQTLMAKYADEVWQHAAAFSATGYKEARAHLEGKLSLEEFKELWTRREIQYAKRQLTWFKKYGQDASWFEVSQTEWQQVAHQIIRSWLEQS